MARLDDLIAFARLHALKIGTIRDLIAYRRRHDHDIERLETATVRSKWGGDWTAITFRNKAVDCEAIALVKGAVHSDQATLVRMHAFDLFADALGHADDRSSLLSRAMEVIAADGNGVVVLFSRDVSMSRLLRVKAGEPLADVKELRDYGVGAQVLAELGIHDMILLTNSRNSPVALEAYGLNIVKRRSI